MLNKIVIAGKVKKVEVSKKYNYDTHKDEERIVSTVSFQDGKNLPTVEPEITLIGQLELGQNVTITIHWTDNQNAGPLERAMEVYRQQKPLNFSSKMEQGEQKLG